MVLVLKGDKTFVGYSDPKFPILKPHLIDIYPAVKNFEIPNENKEHLEWIYAKNYDAWQDVRLIWEKWRVL